MNFMRGAVVCSLLTITGGGLSTAFAEDIPSIDCNKTFVSEGRDDLARYLNACTKQAEGGNIKAQSNLGYIYNYFHDYTETAYWLRRAAEQGDSESQCEIGLIYRRGEGLPQDDRRAAMWFYKASRQDNEQAMYELGLQFIAGEGVPKDINKGLDLIKKSASKVYTPARDYLKSHGTQ